MHGPARNRWLEHSQLVLRAAGLRASAGRSAVVELLARQSCLLGAQDIADQLRAEGSRGSSATVYRALETLHELGLVRRFDADGVARYEPVDPSGDHHHHIVMEESGDVVPFEDAELERAIEGLGERLGMTVTSHDVILRARRS
ncbi:MAG: Fur family transcriptional regulator, ferric uptake regulator [Solirubrobacteraceae bacterium]|jgi:Fe2+ or Zn2+ uptake regulation protein|nr:Fur family transcriptional regulator, ferric uptake regulator [Solirubrobacteraceae bacterium]